MTNKEELFQFFEGKKVLITGHTGFKGAWLTKLLLMAGSNVTGYSMGVPTEISLFELLGLKKHINHIDGDIRDFDGIIRAFNNSQPEIVFHLAAQPIVRASYVSPRYTYETNVMGTVNVCDAIRCSESVRSFVNVTTDKVYCNKEWHWGYRECEPLDGFDPYSNSKSCSELVTHSYINCFFGQNRDRNGVAVSTARAGNVIGGGDFALNRIIPDCVRACKNKTPLVIRNPYSTRPYQHVLEPLYVYLLIAKEQFEDCSKGGFYNVGPDECDCVTTGELVNLFAKYYGTGFDIKAQCNSEGPHEAKYLKLDTSLLKVTFGWRPTWHIEEAIEKTVEWTKVWMKDDSQGTINNILESQITDFRTN